MKNPSKVLLVGLAVFVSKGRVDAAFLSWVRWKEIVERYEKPMSLRLVKETIVKYCADSLD
jgi:hypothetical protein